MAAIEALLILFLMIALGWVLRSRRVVTPAAIPSLSVIELDVAFPCLVFGSSCTDSIRRKGGHATCHRRPIVVERAGGNAAFASRLLVASSAASAVTIPAAVWRSGRWAGV